jgi:hypothetical protein
MNIHLFYAVYEAFWSSGSASNSQTGGSGFEPLLVMTDQYITSSGNTFTHVCSGQLGPSSLRVSGSVSWELASARVRVGKAHLCWVAGNNWYSRSREATTGIPEAARQLWTAIQCLKWTAVVVHNSCWPSKRWIIEATRNSVITDKGDHSKPPVGMNYATE